MANPGNRTVLPGATGRPSGAFFICAVPAIGAALAREAGGSSVSSGLLEAVLQTPLILIWILQRCSGFGRRAVRNADRWLTAIVLTGGVGVSIYRGDVALFFLTATVFIAGSLLLESLERTYQRMDDLLDQPLALLSFFWKRWLALVLITTILLSIPLAVQSAVPDYTYNFWNHVLNSAFAAVGAACLVGSSIYSLGEDYTHFGLGVLVVTSQLAGLGFSAIGLSIIRPFLWNRIRLRTVLAVAMGLQLLAVAVLAALWHETDTPTIWQRCGWGFVYAGDAIWNTGLILRPNGLASYVSNHAVFVCITTLSIVGSLGIPVILDLVQGRSGADRENPGKQTAARDPSPLQLLPRFEAAGAFLLLLLGAILLFYFETPMALSAKYVPERPFDLGQQQVALRDDMDNGQRWSLAVFVSSTLRSAGLQSIPVSEGAVSWPSYGVLLIWMFIGGSAAGVSGGGRISSFVLLAICLFCGRQSWGTKSGDAALRRSIMRRVPMFILAWLAINILACFGLFLVSSGSSYERVFESSAAVNNVSLTTGLSIHLTPPGRLVMIFSMIAGRLIPVFFWLQLADQIRQRFHSR
ncbi:MAG: hypothetical protein MI923_26545 [Phycisphaerales bacterium]|nr:hypothetical protein [Phycisphaerales bacterium]